MKRVTLVNLGGRAHNLEVDAADAVEAWVAEASTRLASDPDRDELLLDFERAIGEKCDAVTANERDVVTVEQITVILESLGAVEPADDTPTSDAPSATQAHDTDSLRSRKLFRLKDEGLLTGVCAGLAAWLRVDVTVVRAVAILFAVLSGGTAIVVYIALAFIVPDADTPEERASVRGFGNTAEDLIRQARSTTQPALKSLGEMLDRAFTVLATIWQAIFKICIALILGTWIVFSIWIVVGGNELMHTFNPGTSHWTAALLLTCAAWVVLVPLISLSGMTGSGSKSFGTMRTVLWIGSWAAALAGTILIVLGTSTSARDVLRDGQGRIQFGDKTVCFRNDQIDQDAPKPSRNERCRKGDVEVNLGDSRPANTFDAKTRT